MLRSLLDTQVSNELNLLKLEVKRLRSKVPILRILTGKQSDFQKVIEKSMIGCMNFEHPLSENHLSHFEHFH